MSIIKNHNLNYRPDIDGLRALAIICVILFHFFPNFLKGGFIGVDIFFVISGYLIFGIITKDLQNNNFTFFKFYFHRFRRIFPALIIVLLFCLIVGWFYLYPEEYKELALQAASGAGFVANFELLRESGYFDNAAELKPLLHLWSLGVEEQFYIICPILLWIYWKIKSKAAAKHGSNILKIILLLIAASFICNIAIINQHPAAAFYLPVSRFWEIAIGAYLAQLQINNPHFFNSSKITKNILPFTGLILIIFSLIFIDKTKPFPSYWAIFPCVGAALLIAANSKSWINKYILSNRLMVGIGLISYPLYLWHWPLLSFARIIKGRQPRLELEIGLIALCVLLAFLTYKFIEKPIRKKFNEPPSFADANSIPLNRGIINVTKHLFILIGAMLVVLAASLVIIFNSGFNNRIAADKNLMIRTASRPDIADQNCLKTYKEIGNNYCRILGNSDKKIFVIGDSHSQAIFSGYAPQLVENGYQIIHLANSGCPFFSSDNTNKVTAEGEDVKKCNVMFKQIIQTAIAAKPSAILFGNGGWNYRKQDFLPSMTETLKMIPKEIPVIYFLQIPAMPFSPLTCVRRKTACAFSKSAYNQNISDYLKVIKTLTSQFFNLKIVNPSDTFCDDKSCFGSDDKGLFYYRDGLHLSEYGSLMIAKKLPIQIYIK